MAAITLKSLGKVREVRDHDTPNPGHLHLEFETGVIVQVPTVILDPGYLQDVSPGRPGITLYTKGNAPRARNKT